MLLFSENASARRHRAGALPLLRPTGDGMRALASNASRLKHDKKAGDPADRAASLASESGRGWRARKKWKARGTRAMSARLPSRRSSRPGRPPADHGRPRPPAKPPGNGSQVVTPHAQCLFTYSRGHRGDGAGRSPWIFIEGVGCGWEWPGPGLFPLRFGLQHTHTSSLPTRHTQS